MRKVLTRLINYNLMSLDRVVYIIDDRSEDSDHNHEDAVSPHTELKKRAKFLGISVVVLVLQYLLKGYLDEISIAIQLQTNSLINCKVLYALMFPEYNGKVIGYMILFQFSNIYACFLFWFTSNSVPFLMTILKLIFSDSRPFWVNSELQPCLCAVNFGNPSTSTFNILAISLVILHAPLNLKSYPFLGTKTFKYSAIVCIIAWNIFVGMIRFLQNAHSLNQLIFGAAWGYWLYYLYFRILGFDSSSKSQLMYLTKNGLKLSLLCASLLLVDLALIYIYPIKELEQSIELRINEVCPDNFSYLELDSYIKSTAIITSGVLILLLWVDLKFRYNGNESKFLSSNFDEETRFNSGLPYWNIFAKIGIYLLIMIILVDAILTPTHNTGLTVSAWFRDPLLISLVIGFIHILGIKLLFKVLGLNKINKRSKLILLSNATIENLEANPSKEEDKNEEGANALGDNEELLLE